VQQRAASKLRQQAQFEHCNAAAAPACGLRGGIGGGVQAGDDHTPLAFFCVFDMGLRLSASKNRSRGIEQLPPAINKRQREPLAPLRPITFQCEREM